MKKFSKILSVALLVALVLSLGAMAWAEGGTTSGEGEGSGEGSSTATTKTITLTGGRSGHTYNLYQIFTGKVDGNELTDIQWGANAPASLKNQYDTAAACAKAVGEQGNARAFAQSLNLSGDGFKKVTLSTNGDVVFSELPEGYYVIIDTNNNVGPVEGDYSSAIVVKVVENVEGALKGEGASSDKKVADNNDTDNIQPALADVADDAWHDSADYDIGDAVPFKLSATTAANVSAYHAYHVTFQDKQSAGLDAPNSWTITVLGKTFTLTKDGDAPEAQTTDKGTIISVERATPDADQTFAIKVSFTQAAGNNGYLDDECDGIVITVKYESVLNENAKIGAEGNPNESYIKYSNNPESKDDQDEGKTPVDKVIVFTYRTYIDKVDETGADLKGADFTLYKQVPKDTPNAVKGSELSFAEGVEHTEIKDGNYYVVVGHKTGNANGDTFQFNGVDDGTYVLVETTVPAGYNAFKSVTVTISAKHSDGDEPALTELTATAPFTVDNKADGTVNRTKKDTTHNRPSGEAYAEIINNSGAVLPSTGGIGTTIFYVVGGVLVLAAIILLVTKKRMSE